MFETSRARPFRLSNQKCCYSDEELRRSSATPSEELSWSDFKVLFAMSGCTAKYEEQLFYLPLAFAYLEEHPDDGLEYLADVVYFVSHHTNGLELLDDLWRYEAHRETEEAMVDSWTRTDRRDTDAAWLLECARELRGGTVHEIAQSNRVTTIVGDEALLQFAYEAT